MPRAVSDHLELLFEQLETNQTLRAEFVANPANAIAPFELTAHERHAVLKHDCDDFIALGMASSNAGLPSVLGCGGGGGRPSIAELIAAIRARLAALLRQRPKVPDRDRPIPPQPGPDPPPGPRRPGG